MKQTKIHISLLLMLFLSMLGSSGLFAQAALGTRIDNICTLDYANEAGATFTLTSNVATVVVTQPLIPKLSLTKVASADTVELGGFVNYTIIARNDGSTALTDLMLVDVINDAYMLPVSVSSNATLNGSTVTYLRDTLRVGESDIVTIVVRVLPNGMDGQTVVNIVNATTNEYGTSVVQTQASIVTKSKSTVIETHPQLHLEKVASRDTVVVGDTVRYSIILENTGDVTLHGVNVNDTLSSQIRIASVSRNATMRGSIVQYLRESLAVGERDSVEIIASVNSTTPAGTSILNRAFATADELNSATKVAEATFITQQPLPEVPRSLVRITKHASSNIILVGQNVKYSLVIENILPTTVQNIVVVDTISAKLIPINVSANAVLKGQLVTYRRDSLSAFERDSLVIEVQVPENRPHNEIILNVAYAMLNGVVVDSSDASIRTKVIAVDRSCLVSLQVVPPMVIGNGINAAKITAFISDTTGKPKPDGTPVLFRTDVGYFSNGLDSIVVGTKGGIAIDSLRTIISIRAIVHAKATISVSDADICNASSSIDIIFYPGAITGQVIDNEAKTPVEGALVQVFSSSGQLVGTQITGRDGQYLIPVPKTDNYRVVITVNDRFGMLAPAITYVAVTVPGTGGVSAVHNQSIISGRIYFIVSGQPYVGRGIKVLLSRVSSNETLNKSVSTGLVAMDSTVTDTTGLYVFTNLSAGNYQVSIVNQLLTGVISTSLPDSGRYVLNLNIAITLNPQITFEKKGPAAANLNDTASYTISAENSGGISTTNTTIIDSLDRGMQFLSALGNGVYDSLTHTVSWNVGRLDSADGPAHKWNGRVHVRFVDSVNINRSMLNHGIFKSNETSPLYSDVSTYVSNPKIQITKMAMKKVVEIGDVVPYIIKVTNASPTLTLSHLDIVDRIPFGFSLAKGSVFRDSTKIPDPARTRELHIPLSDSIKPNQTIQMSYRLIVGAGGMESDGINTAYATALDPQGRFVSSPEATEHVEVRRGLFTDHGIIIGKVFFDQNQDAYQDTGEVGVKGVELIMENGIRVITGDDGKYSIPDIESGQHVIQVRRATIPKNATLVAGYNKFAGDAGLRFVNVPVSGIARADFYLAGSEAVSAAPVQLRQSIVKIGNLSIQRYAAPKNLVFFEDESPALMRLSGLTFEVAKAKLRPEAFPVLRRLSQLLKELPEQTVNISGHTDADKMRTKEFKNNLELSIARANAVKSYLVTVLGWDESQIAVTGHGENWPVATNKTAFGKSLNRRVEFDFSGSKTPMKKRDTVSVLYTIPIRYDGNVALTNIKIYDKLDSAIVVIPESGLLGDRSIVPQYEHGELVWKIDSIGRKFESVLRYRANIAQPGARKLNLKARTVKVTAMAGDSLIIYTDTLETITSTAIAVRGRGVNFILSDILFDAATATLRSGAESALDVTGMILKRDATTRVVIDGHTDSTPIRGKEFSSNMALSFARARSVAGTLANTFGISRDRIRIAGYGEFRPVASNNYVEGRQRNRRVEIRILRKEFIDRVMPDGGVDSSANGTIAIHSKTWKNQLESVEMNENDSRLMMQLEMKNLDRSPQSTITLIDTLPKGWSVEPGSIRKLRGVDSVTVAGNIITAKCSRRDTLAQIMFNLIRVSDTEISQPAIHTFVAVRNDGDAQEVIERAYPIVLGFSQKIK